MRRVIPLTLIALASAVGQPGVLPQPLKLVPGDGAFELLPDTAILCDASLNFEGQLLSRTLAPATGYSFPVMSGAKARDNVIVLSIDPSLARLGDEGYTVEVTPKRVIVKASKPAGVFYATQSLRQLLPAAIFAPARQTGVAWRIPAVSIEDRPRFVWRGAMIDTARHFMPKPDLLHMLDAMAAQKLNTLHLHLTDDQGWRIEIRKYPKLTEIGSMRKETRIGHENKKLGFDGRPHGGFYTQDDLRQIVAYARERHITVVPEIEMPGHAQAAIAAYPQLGNTDEKLEVSTTWGVNKHVFNANETTILLLQDVLTEVLEIFPSQFIHVGGDEVPKDEWKASPVAQARIRELGLKNEDELQSYIIRSMDKFLASKGRRLVGWDEILEGGLAPGATVMSWRGIEGGIAAARQGHDVVMTPTKFTYFDYYQAKSPAEPPAIGGLLPLETVYSFEPIPTELNAQESKRVLGTQGQLWSEYLPTPYAMEYMAFPRLAALAEVAWSATNRKNYTSFTERLRAQEERWRIAGVNFRPLNGK
ncbi:MAG TPA: beta-N-acetylhexosaminidase [Anaerolineae bacterium]